MTYKKMSSAPVNNNKIDLGVYGSVDEEAASKFLGEKGQVAMEFSKRKLLELKKYADEGDWTWKVAGFIAGLAIVGLSLLSLLSHLFGLSPIDAILDVYMIALGSAACVLEYKEKTLTQKQLDALRREALFLYRPYGRAGNSFPLSFEPLLLAAYRCFRQHNYFYVILRSILFLPGHSASLLRRNPGQGRRPVCRCRRGCYILFLQKGI